MKLPIISDIPRITRTYFCENMDIVLDRVSEENMAYVICEEDKDDLILCPAAWFKITLNDNIFINLKESADE